MVVELRMQYCGDIFQVSFESQNVVIIITKLLITSQQNFPIKSKNEKVCSNPYLLQDVCELRELVDGLRMEREKMKEEKMNLNQEVNRLKEVENILAQLRQKQIRVFKGTIIFKLLFTFKGSTTKFYLDLKGPITFFYLLFRFKGNVSIILLILQI